MRIVNPKSLIILALFAAVMLVPSCQKDDDGPVVVDLKEAKDYNAEVVTAWDQMFLDIERYAAGYRPGPAPRALAYIGLASYEACISGMPDYKSVAGLYAGLSIPAADLQEEYHWPTVVNATRAYLLRRFFPFAPNDLFQKISTLQTTFDTRFATETRPDIFQRSKAHGEAVAAAVWEWSKTDQIGHDAYLDPFKGYNWEEHYKKPGDWRPSTPGPGKAMFPFWGRARTFAISESDKLCPPPLPYSESPNSPLFNQAMEVYAQTVNASYENSWIAEFWSDDLVNLTFSPGPRWLAIANQAYDIKKVSLETALYSDAKVGMALNDAAVSCWYSKYYYNVERPVTYINRLIDPKWKSALFNPLTNDSGITPSFPAYPSGHSTMGAAAAEVLTDIFGIRFPMTDRCHETRTEFEGKPRAFTSFYEMAEENAWSRIPLGVHFRMDAEQGVNLGYRCGYRVNSLPWKK